MPTAEEEKWEFYQDGYKNWRWKMTNGDDVVILESAESYSTRKLCVQNARDRGFTGKLTKYSVRFISMLVSSI
jgi:uncharacterized protein YegP (UPF0339 family)